MEIEVVSSTTDLRSLRSTRARPCSSAQENTSWRAEVWVSLRPRTRASSTGPNSVTVVRSGVAAWPLAVVESPRVSSSRGKDCGCQGCAVVAVRAVRRGEACYSDRKSVV